MDKIELIVAQVSPGPATHKVRMEREGDIVVWHRFDSDLAADGHVFALRLDPPQYIDKVRILTTRHEGWVALREVRILSSALLSESVSGLLHPVQLTHAGDGSGRLFVLEKEGRIRIVRDGVLVETPFLDISQRISASGTEQGLQNVAFPPSYVKYQRFYVSYTDTNGDTVISRFTTSADLDRADPDSEEIILTINQPGALHNGGTLKFGPRDGYLYVASGDGHEPFPTIFRSRHKIPAHYWARSCALMLSRARNLTRFRLTIRLCRSPATRPRYGRWAAQSLGHGL